MKHQERRPSIDQDVMRGNQQAKFFWRPADQMKLKQWRDARVKAEQAVAFHKFSPTPFAFLRLKHGEVQGTPWHRKISWYDLDRPVQIFVLESYGQVFVARQQAFHCNLKQFFIELPFQPQSDLDVINIRSTGIIKSMEEHSPLHW